MRFLGKSVTGVVFDMDGLLLDTERISLRAWQTGARQYGVVLPDEVFGEMIGHRNADCLAILQRFAQRELPLDDISAAMYADYERRLAAGIPVMRGARELVEMLHGADVRLSVATSTHRQLAMKKLESVGLLRFFKSVTGGDQVARGKPAPDIYLAAAASLGVRTEDCVAFEDSSPGVLAAAAAGMRVVGVPDMRALSPEALRAACAVASDLAEAATWFQK